MSTHDLFGGASEPSKVPAEKAKSSGAARVLRPERGQQEWRTSSLDDLLPEDHRARAMWALISELDLSRFYEHIAARDGVAGRPAIDPAILVGLWLYATAEGVGSARQLARLCEEHDAYRWICGGVGVNHHTLSDFRVSQGKALDELLTQLLGVLMSEDLVRLRRVAQDGMRVRASAGASSFRRQSKLERCLEKAEAQIAALKAQAEHPDPGRTAREQAAAERAAVQRARRVRKALKLLPRAAAAKSNHRRRGDASEARVSTTDPEARVMKMADGGFRPAYNVQLAADTESRVIVGVSVTDRLDHDQMVPMLDQIERRTGRKPDEHLVDGGFASKRALEDADARGVTVLSPVMQPKLQTIERHRRKKDDSPAVAAWRERMGSEQAQRTYRERAATVETVNGDLKTWRGLDRFGVRGLDKALAVAMWSVLAYNLLRWASLTAVT